MTWNAEFSSLPYQLHSSKSSHREGAEHQTSNIDEPTVDEQNIFTNCWYIFARIYQKIEEGLQKTQLNLVKNNQKASQSNDTIYT